MASFASLAFRKLLQPSLGNTLLRTSLQTVALRKSPSCKRSIPCRRNTRRVFPASSAEATSGVAPSLRRYVRILQRCRSPPSPRHRDLPEPIPRPRWPANPAVSQRRRPWLPRNPPDGTPGRDIFALPSALFHKRRIRHGAYPYFLFDCRPVFLR